jgi:hypothetical protein
MTEMLEYDIWLRDFASKSEHPIIRDSEAVGSYLLQLDAGLPAEYGWRLMDLNGLGNHCRTRWIEGLDLLVLTE